jgi:hypothetical protein
MSEPISALTNEQIEERLAAIMTQYSELGLTVDSSDEDVATAQQLAEEVTELRAELGTRADRAAKIDELDGVFTTEDAAPAVDEPDAEAVAEAVAEADETPAEVVAEVEEALAEVGTEEAVVAEETPAVEAEEVLEPVAASAQTTTTLSPAERAAANAPEVQMSQSTAPAVLTAAADVTGFAAGQELDSLDRVGEALINRLRAMPANRVPNTRLQFGVSKITLDGFGEGLTQGRGHDDFGLVHAAGSEARLDGGSLTAAGGWCAPSETLYDLCQYESTDGLLDLPEFNVTRGGIRYTSGPDFMDIYNNCGFDHTEEEIEQGVTKNCCEVDCPDFEEIRLDAVGLCIKAPLLTNAAYPELVRRYIEGALIAHQHKLSAKIIQDMIAAAIPQPTPLATYNQGTLLFHLDTLEWQATAMRYAYRLPETATIELVAPLWLKPLIRAEFARRNGVEAWAVTDAEIMNYFSVRHLSIQFVYNYQNLVSYPNLVDVPQTVRILMYPAGTWTKGVADVINLDAVYDSTQLEQNMYTALFVEQGQLAVQRCLSTQEIELPVGVAGLTGAQITEYMGVEGAAVPPPSLLGGGKPKQVAPPKAGK